MRRLAIVVLAGACGRINFDPLSAGDCALAIEPAASSVNLNTPVQLTAQGATGALTWRVASGQGRIDGTGRFFAGDRVETVTIEATDAAGCSGTATIDVHGSTLFYVGGEVGAGTPIANVYSSADGMAWQAFGALPAARTRGKLVVFLDRMWWLGGSVNTVWSSTDGAVWTTEAPMPVGLSELGTAVYDGRMWSIGGTTGANVDSVYSTADGVTWQVTGHLPVALHGTRCLGYLDRLWCLGGHTTGRIAGVFSTVDGVTWVDEAPLPFIREEQGQIVLPDGRLVLIGGSDDNGPQRDGAVTADGVAWTIQGALPQDRFVTDFVRLGDTLYLAGADVSVLASTDGATWAAVGTLPAYVGAGGFVAFTPH